MYVQFVPVGRLGNAIFRYMACVIMCKYYHAEYFVDPNRKAWFGGISDPFFQKISAGICSGSLIPLNPTRLKESKQTFITMFGYYQHDMIYLQHKQDIIDYILAHPDHAIYTDGIRAGDGRYQKYLVQSFIQTPPSFDKQYPFVLHLRLEDFITYHLYIPSERLIKLLEELIQTQTLDKQLVIVCNQPTTERERKYIQTLVDLLHAHHIQVVFEHNDPLTDYYILREAETLIASNSTLCWAATFFSSRLKTCYFPKYTFTVNQTFCKPVEQTFYY